MMNSSEPPLDHRDDVSGTELEDWVSELICEDHREFVVNDSGAAATTIVPNYPLQPTTTGTVNGGTILRGGSTANKSQSGISEIMTNNLAANTSTAALPRSGQVLSAAPNYYANPVAQSSWSSRTTDLPQYQPSQPLQNQPLSQQVLTQKAIQQPQTNSSIEQSNIGFGHQNRMPSNQIQPYPRPMVNGQMGHMQNRQALWQQSNTNQLQQPQPQPQPQPVVQPIQNFQQNLNQMNLQFQQPSSSSGNLISGDGRNRLQGLAINDGQRKPQQQQQGLIANGTAGSGVFRAPSAFPNADAWSEYAFRQILQMKQIYFNDLLLMQRNARQLCLQQTDAASASKYETVKKFLEKMIAFLSIPTVELIPKNYERVHGYMNFIVGYLHSFRNRNRNGGGSSQHLQLLLNQPPQLQPANMRLQYSPQQNPAQGVANLETSMLNFNQNFPSRRPQQVRIATTSSVNNVGFQTGMDQRPANSLHVNGTFNGEQLNGLSTATQKSSSGLLTTTTTATNFQSRQLNNQPAAVPRSSSEKLKQPMCPLGASRMVNQFHSPPFLPTPSVGNKPIIQPIGAPGRSSWNGGSSSSRVDANNVLSPQSIAHSPFLVVGSSSTPIQHAEQKQLSSSGLSSLSTEESKKPETLIMSVQPGDLGTVIRGKVPDTGAASRTPTTSSVGTEKSQESSQDLNDQHLRLVRVVKSLSPKALSSSLNDICSAKKAMDSIPYGEPPNPMAPYREMEPSFLLEFDNEAINLIAPDESGFLFEYENERGQKTKRRLSITSLDCSSPDLRDHDSFDQLVSEEWDMDSTGTSMKKRPKIERENWAILEEMKEINNKLLETSLEVSEDNISLHEGTRVKCLYRNVSFPGLFTLMGASSSQKKPEFVIELLVPVDYPASSPIISNSCCNVPGELCGMLYKEMVCRFERSVRELGEKMSIGEMARHWDECARGVVSELAQQQGAGSLVSSYGKWESCSYS